MKLSWNPPQLTNNRAEFRWRAPYSASVHQGYFRKDNTRAPARPWADITVSEVDIPSLFFDKAMATISGDRHLDLDTAFAEFCSQMEQEFGDRIQSKRYEWDRVTRRRVGGPSGQKIVGSPRDIVDTSRLLNSLTVVFSRV